MKPAANNAYNELLEGNLLIAPTGARGYVRGYANLVNGESMRPYAPFQNEQEVMDLAKQHTEAYHPYTGWILNRLEPVDVKLTTILASDKIGSSTYAGLWIGY